MLFNSYIFILLFMPLCFAGYFGMNALGRYRLAQLFLLGMSLWFYGYFNPAYLLIILSSIGINYAVAQWMGRMEAPAFRKGLLVLGVAVNLGILGYFKYMDFFIGMANRVLRTDMPLPGIMLPLGISFFTFQQISFMVDAYRGETGDYGMLEYACYVTYFPQLIAGPIVTHDELIPQLRAVEKKRIDWDDLAMGIYIFSIGLAKKVLLADTFGNAANFGFAHVDGLDSTAAWITMLAYTLQIYLDFSGYCDMAVGIGKMMNIDLPVNFNSPYKAKTITEFWDRWHMTLTRFFTRYVYIPMGGNRRGKLRTYGNILLVFFLSGFWHGAGFSFIVWGLLHGAFSVVTRCCGKLIRRLPGWINWLVTFLFVNATWVLFRADSLSEGIRILKTLVHFRFGPVLAEQADCFLLPELLWLEECIPLRFPANWAVMGIFFLATMAGILFAPNSYEKMKAFRPTLLRMTASACCLVWSVFSLTGVSTFLYFNF